MSAQKSLTITVFNFTAVNSFIYLTQAHLTSGFLYKVEGPGRLANGDSTPLVFLPTEEAKDAGPVGELTFLISGTNGEALQVYFVWDATNTQVAVLTNKIPGFTVEVSDDNLNDPNNPSYSVVLRTE